MSARIHSRPRRRTRSGAAMIEFAIAMPILFAVAIGTIETCQLIYLRQSLKLAAYEAARVGIMPGMTADVMQDQCDLILVGRNIVDYSFSCTPADPTTLEYGELLTTTVDAPMPSNSIVGTWFFSQSEIAESVTIMAEH